MKAGYGLIESMRAAGGRAPLLRRHLHRLRSSAATLGIPLNDFAIGALLNDAIRAAMAPSKVRLEVDVDGKPRVDVEPIGALPENPVAILANIHLNSDDPLLRHKTTRRKVYDIERARLADVESGYDVIFLNERGEACEGAISNVFAWFGGEVATPPVDCGLLPGVQRAEMIREHGAIERILLPENLEAADRIVLTNAVRGAVDVKIVGAVPDNYLR